MRSTHRKPRRGAKDDAQRIARRSCDSGKARITTRKAAHSRAVRLTGMLGVTLRAYRCPLCRDWHLTRQAKRDPTR